MQPCKPPPPLRFRRRAQSPGFSRGFLASVYAASGESQLLCTENSVAVFRLLRARTILTTYRVNMHSKRGGIGPVNHKHNAAEMV